MDKFLYILVWAISVYAAGTAVACAVAWRRGRDLDPAHKGWEHDA